MIGKKRKEPPTENHPNEFEDKKANTLKKFKQTKTEELPTFIDDFTTILISGDGNCLFRAILYSGLPNLCKNAGFACHMTGRKKNDRQE